jgi:hypothetical protein
MAVGSYITVRKAAAAAFPGQQPYDLIALATAKAELQISDTSHDADLGRWITAASAASARFCNRVFPIELLEELLYPDRDYFPQVVVGEVKPLQLRRWPISNSPCIAGIPAPNPLPNYAPVLGSVPGGALAAAFYYVRQTYLTALGETAAGAEANLAVAANNLLTVAAPGLDQQALATGWNCYVGTASGQETLQNASPLAVAASFTLPPTGLVAGAVLPNFVSVIENTNPLVEGVDFLVDYDDGQLTRLDVNAYPKRWPQLRTAVLYSTGWSLSDPTMADAQEAVTRMVKARYFGQTRDPALRQENVEGVWSAQYWFGAGPGAAVGDLPPDIMAMLDRYRALPFG